MALELKRDATQEEIRSAFRRIAKLYHPDQDSSPYAEQRYRDARRAYEALYKRRTVRVAEEKPQSPNPAETRQAHATRGQANFSGAGFNPWTWQATCCGDGWYAYDCDCDDLPGQGFGERIPFLLEKMPFILCKSIIEIASIETFIRVLLYVIITNSLLSRLGYSGITSNVVAFCSLVVFAFFRYYHPGDDEKSNLRTKFLWSLKYILSVGFLLIVFSPERSIFLIGSWLNVPFEMFIALFLLWAPRIFQGKRYRHR